MNKRILTRFAVVLVTAIAVVFFYQSVRTVPDIQPAQQIASQQIAEQLPSGPSSVIETPEQSEAELVYPVGKLSISGRRESYVSGDMILEIPRLDLVCPVLDGTEKAELDKGVGLFEYAQLPGISNSNTSMAAHRDIYGKEFYFIHNITDGDLMYLTYEGKKYTYEYMETFITNDSDWDPIRSKEFACITLQSCDPIGTSLNRIFVVGKLIDIQDLE